MKLAPYNLDRVRKITGIRHPTQFTDWPPDSTARREQTVRWARAIRRRINGVLRQGTILYRRLMNRAVVKNDCSHISTVPTCRQGVDRDRYVYPVDTTGCTILTSLQQHQLLLLNISLTYLLHGAEPFLRS